jgi:hypothetical protein
MKLVSPLVALLSLVATAGCLKGESKSDIQAVGPRPLNCTYVYIRFVSRGKYDIFPPAYRQESHLANFIKWVPHCAIVATKKGFLSKALKEDSRLRFTEMPTHNCEGHYARWIKANGLKWFPEATSEEIKTGNVLQLMNFAKTYPACLVKSKDPRFLISDLTVWPYVWWKPAE